MTTANPHQHTVSHQTLLNQESTRLTQTLRRIEALCEAGPKSRDLGEAQEMIALLQRRIERLRRLDRSLQAS